MAGAYCAQIYRDGRISSILDSMDGMDGMDTAGAVQALLTPEGRRDPYPLYDILRAGGPVLPGIVTGYAAAAQVLRDPVYRMVPLPTVDGGDAAAEWLSLTMLFSNPPDHERLRGLVSRAFTARRVAALRPEVERITGALLDELDGDVDFMDTVAYPLPVGVICALLGVPDTDRDWFRPRARDLTYVLELVDPDPAALVAAGVAAAELRDYFTELIAARNRSPRDDLVGALLLRAGELSGRELLANLALLLIAGFETTTNLLGNGLAVLLRRPALLDRLRADPGLTAAYVEEMLRFDAPVQATSRRPAENTELYGVRQRAGTEVYVFLGAANRDPARFADPAVFDPDRPANQPLSFGAGPHFCLGAALARLEAQVAFPMLLRRFPKLAPAGEPQRRDRFVFRGYARLPVTVSTSKVSVRRLT